MKKAFLLTGYRICIENWHRLRHSNCSIQLHNWFQSDAYQPPRAVYTTYTLASWKKTVSNFTQHKLRDQFLLLMMTNSYFLVWLIVPIHCSELTHRRFCSHIDRHLALSILLGLRIDLIEARSSYCANRQWTETFRFRFHEHALISFRKGGVLYVLFGQFLVKFIRNSDRKLICNKVYAELKSSTDKWKETVLD